MRLNIYFCITKQMSDMGGYIAALSAALMWSISSTLFTTVGKRIGALNLNALRIVIRAFLFFLSNFIIYGTFFPNVNAQQLLILSLRGIIGLVVSLWLSMISIKYAQVGIASTLLSTTPIMIIPVVYFLNKERVNIRGIFGAVVAVIGIALIFLF